MTKTILMRFNLILTFVFSLSSFQLFCQNAYPLHPSVGDTLEQIEKLDYSLFPFIDNEPFDYGVIGFEGDRSTGNRLFLWETFHYLNSLNDFRFELKLLETDYEWVKSGLVNLPNTSTYKRFEVPSDVFELNPTKNQTDETMVDELLPYFHDGKKLPLKDIFINVFGLL